MEIKIANNWPEFINAIAEVRDKYAEFTQAVDEDSTWRSTNRIMFRGQTKSAWDLLTTLERKTDDRFTIKTYVHRALLTKFELESYTGKSWAVPHIPEVEKEIEEHQDGGRVFIPHHVYEYLVFLRHHGFPSPLLDWTESPYIAAYFALEGCRDDAAAVYCYIERTGITKGGVVGSPMITVFGPYATTHKRHFAQKAWYTVATQWDYRNESHLIVPHSNIFSGSSSTQDVLVKITLSAAMRKDALRALSDYNINHFTLFQSEDSLIKALEQKLFDLRNEPGIIRR